VVEVVLSREFGKAAGLVDIIMTITARNQAKRRKMLFQVMLCLAVDEFEKRRGFDVHGKLEYTLQKGNIMLSHRITELVTSIDMGKDEEVALGVGKLVVGVVAPGIEIAKRKIAVLGWILLVKLLEKRFILEFQRTKVIERKHQPPSPK